MSKKVCEWFQLGDPEPKQLHACGTCGMLSTEPNLAKGSCSITEDEIEERKAIAFAKARQLKRTLFEVAVVNSSNKVRDEDGTLTFQCPMCEDEGAKLRCIKEGDDG